MGPTNFTVHLVLKTEPIGSPVPERQTGACKGFNRGGHAKAEGPASKFSADLRGPCTVAPFWVPY